MLNSLPFFGGLGAKPSNKSIIGAAPAFEVSLVETERDERSSNGETGVLLFVLGDKMSVVDEVVGADGDPIDKRSKRTSVPLFGASPAPKMQLKARHCMD